MLGNGRHGRLNSLLFNIKRTGGGYKKIQNSQQSLKDWTAQKWRTKSGKPSSKTGERYLPEKAIEALSPAEYAKTTKAKRKGTAAGKQFVKQPPSIAQKTAKYRCGDESIYRKKEILNKDATMRRWLAMLLLIGTLGVVDIAPAKTPEEQTTACQQGTAWECSLLGYMYSKGAGVTQDDFKAAEFYRHACEGKDAGGCFNLGVMYETGEGVTQDNFKAVELYRHACDGKDAGGCFNLGVMYETGAGVTQDPAKAVELYRHACEGKVAEGCFYLGGDVLHGHRH